MKTNLYPSASVRRYRRLGRQPELHICVNRVKFATAEAYPKKRLAKIDPASVSTHMDYKIVVLITIPPNVAGVMDPAVFAIRIIWGNACIQFCGCGRRNAAVTGDKYNKYFYRTGMIDKSVWRNV